MRCRRDTDSATRQRAVRSHNHPKSTQHGPCPTRRALFVRPERALGSAPTPRRAGEKHAPLESQLSISSRGSSSAGGRRQDRSAGPSRRRRQGRSGSPRPRQPPALATAGPSSAHHQTCVQRGRQLLLLAPVNLPRPPRVLCPQRETVHAYRLKSVPRAAGPGSHPLSRGAAGDCVEGALVVLTRLAPRRGHWRCKQWSSPTGSYPARCPAPCPASQTAVCGYRESPTPPMKCR